jgi:hypothetical protein
VIVSLVFMGFLLLEQASRSYSACKLLDPKWLVEIGPNEGFGNMHRSLTSKHRCTLPSQFARKVVRRC